MTRWSRIQFLFFSVQIIHGIKGVNDPDAKKNIDDICDRIFQLVDKNNDSKSQADDLGVLFSTSCLRAAS